MNFIKTAFSGMQSAQAHMSAVSMNLANLHTKGYSRQEVQQSSVHTSSNNLNAGDGVRVDSIKRISDEYLVRQEWNAISNHAYYEGKNSYLDKLEIAVANSDTSLTTGFDKFYNSLSSLSTSPDSTSLRKQLINDAKLLTMRFTNANREADDQSAMINKQRDIVIEQINILSKDIAGYNKKVEELTYIGGNTNALLDKREQKIKELNQLIDVKVTNSDRGYLNLTLQDGQPLVDGMLSSVLKSNAVGGNFSGLQLEFANSTFDIDSSCGSLLGGINDYQSDVLQKTKDNINKIAEEFAAEFNHTLNAGDDLNGSAGVDLFIYDPANPKGALQVTDIKPDEIALAKRGEAIGDNQNAIALINTKSKSLVGLGGMSLDDSCIALVSDMGIESRLNKNELSAAKDVMVLSTAQRESVTGVNMNEEGESLIQYQSLYQANMRVMNMGNKLFSDLLALF
ncbi:flagellar hook-associated protein FlgK [Yersinia bercovieri]|uniref:flagellar hook-associated protein FlgK n=1 Tax=Yersinia bercovieri TaxID=634 RepID=UPI0011A479BB|nr:flagellar hook-associated protein FlgK [Yersinia bercovieri]